MEDGDLSIRSRGITEPGMPFNKKMCRKCDIIRDEVRRLYDHLKLSQKQCKRSDYHRKYYQANRDRKLAASNKRYEAQRIARRESTQG